MSDRRAGWHDLRFIAAPGKIQVSCAECGVAMWLPPSKVHEYRRCGIACNAAYRLRVKEERRRECATCGKDFYPRTTQIRAGHGIYCSQKCNTAGLAAMFDPDAFARGRAKMREMREAGLIKYRKGETHHQWTGGKPATLQRRQLNGKAAAEQLRYRHANPDKMREFSQRRTSRKTGRLPKGTVSKIGTAQRWRCAICRVSIKTKYHVDHVFPLALGGKHVAANIQLLCPTCNVRKAAKDPIEYMQSLGRLL